MVYLPTAGSRGRDKSGDGREIGRGALTDWRGQKESGRKKASEVHSPPGDSRERNESGPILKAIKRCGLTS